MRLFVIGSQTKASSKVEETQEFYQSAVRPRALANFIFEHPEIHWNIRDLPGLPKRTITLNDVLDDLPDSSDFWWSEERTSYLVSQMSDKHLMVLQGMIGRHCWSHGTVFRRVRKGKSMAELRTDGVAGCLRTPRGGSGRQILVQVGFGEVKARLLTPRECARLMGANDFRIETSLNKALFGFGDAVCIPVISWLAQYYLNPLLEESTAKKAALGKTKIKISA